MHERGFKPDSEFTAPTINPSEMATFPTEAEQPPSPNVVGGNSVVGIGTSCAEEESAMSNSLTGGWPNSSCSSTTGTTRRFSDTSNLLVLTSESKGMIVSSYVNGKDSEPNGDVPFSLSEILLNPSESVSKRGAVLSKFLQYQLN